MTSYIQKWHEKPVIKEAITKAVECSGSVPAFCHLLETVIHHMSNKDLNICNTRR